LTDNLIRILFFSAATSYGGGERYLITLLPLLKAKGYGVALICQQADLFRSIEDYIIDESGVDYYDFVVFNGNGALYKWSRSIRRFNKKSIFVMHSSLYDAQGIFYKRLLRPLILKWYLNKIDLVLRVAKSCVTDSFHENIATVYNGVFLGRKLRSRRSNFGELKLCILGALNANKNQILAIQSLLELPKNITLTIIGDGPLRTNLELFVRELHLEKRVFFLGFKDDPVSVIRMCDCLLITSKIEAFPFSALEAMSVGVPVISSNVGGISELIEDGFNGFLFDINCKDELILKIRFFHALESERRFFGKNAWATIAHKFTAQSMANNFIDSLISL
jgi:glycosyltransferase involved in cell wall biosynthesis